MIAPADVQAAFLSAFNAQLENTPYGRMLLASLTDEQRATLLKVASRTAVSAAQTVDALLDAEAA